MNLNDTSNQMVAQKSTMAGPITPDSITGVLTTRPGQSKITIDYFRATFPNTPEHRKRIRETFAPGKGRKTTLYGYEFMATVLERGKILWSESSPELGILLDLPASALAHWGRPIDWLIDIARNNGGKIGRIDIAFDDHSGLLNLREMLHSLDVGDVVCRGRSHRPFFESTAIGAGPGRLTGIEVGSRASETYLRIYDKRIEQTGPNGEYDGPDKWIRVELELKGDRSDAASKMIVDSIRAGKFSEWAASLLYGWVDFKERSETDDNKSRWETAIWWAEFIGNVRKTRLSLPDKVQTIEQVCSWFETSISPMAAVILLQKDIDGLSGYDWIMDVITAGQDRWQKKHRRLAGIEAENEQETKVNTL